LSKDNSTFPLFRGNHDETPFWRDEIPFWDDETGFFEFLSLENPAIFGLIWDDFGEKHGDTENIERNREKNLHSSTFFHSSFYPDSYWD